MLSTSLREATELIRSIDPSGIERAQELRRRQGLDWQVTCRSGRKHLVRLSGGPSTLRSEHWGYAALRRLGVPCPQIELWLEPDERFPNGCLVVEWIDRAVAPAEILDREGRSPRTLSLCARLGRALRGLHSSEVAIDVPDLIPRVDRANVLWYGGRKARALREAGLVDAAFERKFLALVERGAARIPDPHPPTLCFQDMHFRNILVSGEPDPDVVAFVDVAEVAVGCPVWDFTNWERWELYYGHAWAREPVLEAYGPIDMELYRFAVLVRFAESHDLFRGAVGRQIARAVESGDLMAFDLDRLGDEQAVSPRRRVEP